MTTKQLAAAYVRVSTTQQAQHDLSIPDQANQINAFAKQRDMEVVQVFVEPGASARDNDRKVFQEMISAALMKPPKFSCILVHSMSRLFRDEMYWEIYRRKLEANGVKIVSIAQEFGEGPGAELTRRIVALTDEINSVENAKHVRRTILENAKQGYWNGAAAPLGFVAAVAEIRGTKQKKKLEVHAEDSATVRLIYRLHEGDGTSGPRGIKNITVYLNERGYKTPKGNKFHTSYVGKILTDEVYVVRFWWGTRDSRSGQARPREEWVLVQVPPIISEEDFQRGQLLLAQRAPKTTPPRLVNSSVLLTGAAVCGGCGEQLRRYTGKGGSYGYYGCSGKMRTGFCSGNAPARISAAQLDHVVLNRLLDGLLTPERVQEIVAEVAAKTEAARDEIAASLARLRTQRAKCSTKAKNLMNVLAEGLVEATATFRDTMKAAEEEGVRLTQLIATQERIIGERTKPISIEEAAEVASDLRTKLLGGAPGQKKRILRSFVQKVIVAQDEIVIVGAKSDLAELVTGTPVGAFPANRPRRRLAPSFERGWWTRLGSNQ